jgi:dienelactone hydrolase
MPEYRTGKEWNNRRKLLQKQILRAAGLDPMPARLPLKPVISGRIAGDGFTVEKVLLETFPGYYLGGNLYRPAGMKGKFPAVVSPHGHWDKGRLEQTGMCSVPARGVSLARQGYIVFTYDMVGYNDTKQTPHRFGSEEEQLWSFGPLALQLWNSIRATDFLLSLGEVNRARVAATGASGGGTQTFLLTAVDDRVRYSAPVNMVSAHMQGGCVCENAPGLRVGAFNVEIAAIMAPRPMLLVSATGDWTKNVPKEEFPAIQHIYALLGHANRTEVVQIDAKHNYNQQSREAVYRFFARHIQGLRDTSGIQEQPVRKFADEELLALAKEELPQGAINHEQLFEHWRKISDDQNSGITNLREKRKRLAEAIGATWPEDVRSQVESEQIVLWRTGKGDRVPGLWLEGKGDPALVVHSEGSRAARESDAVKQLAAAGRPALLIDAFQAGAAKAPRDLSRKHYLTFQLSDDARRAQDILTALKYLEGLKRGRPELIGLEKAAVWSLFAAAVAPIPLKLKADVRSFQGEDKEFVQQFFVPGIKRAGGLPAAMALTAAARQR